MRVAVIGAGPGGLVTLKYLLEAHKYFPVEPIEARCFEAESDIGGTFRYRTYDQGEMVSSAAVTTFSDFRIPLDEQEGVDFLPIPRYVEYLDDYAEHFRLREHISLKTRVTNVRREKEGRGHIVTYESQDGQSEEWRCDAVAVCAGLHVTPSMPHVQGIERVPEVWHSSKFKHTSQFGKGKDIVVLGAGETAMDLALFAVKDENVKSVTVAHRGGFCIVPKYTPYANVMGKDETGPILPPIDTIWSSIFDGAYAHPRLRNSKYQWEFYDKWNKFGWSAFDCTSGGYAQHAGIIKNLRLQEVIFVKNQRVSLFFNPKYDEDTAVKRWKRKVIDVVRENKTNRYIDIAPWPTHVDEDGYMHFEKNDSVESKYAVPIKPDLVIYATGYEHHGFPFLSPGYPDSKDCDIRAIWREGDEDVAFIGFVRPQLGAIPPLTEFQAQLWIQMLCKQLPNHNQPLEYENWYGLIPRPEQRIQHGVDHESYAYQLALDMGSAPSFTQMLTRGPKVFTTWAIGSNYNTNFRLQGPYKWDGAEEVMKTEFWNLIPRRGVMWGFIMLNALPMVWFGVLSLFFFLLDLLLWPVEAVQRGFGRVGSVAQQRRYRVLAQKDQESGGKVKTETVDCW